MGASSSRPWPPATANLPTAQLQEGEDAVSAKLRSLDLIQYITAFQERGYDDLAYLSELSQDELLDLAKRVGMLEGHAAKWVRAVSGATISPSKVKIALRSAPPPCAPTAVRSKSRATRTRPSGA